MPETRVTFAEHIHELRKRLMWSVLFVGIGAGVGYVLHGFILSVLQKPLNETLYYTTPTGAFSFIVKICCVFGIVVALPVVVYQVFSFFGPLLPSRTRRSIVLYVFLSVILAGSGMAFAYFISLPAALHFLVNFGSEAGDIKALITANEYFNFVITYLAGFAVLFQLPLIISFINRMTPLKPSQLMGGTRYVVLGSFVISAIITPTPDPLNQGLMAGPIILLYFVSVAVVAMTNAAKRRKKLVPAVPDIPTAGIEAVLADGELLSAVPVFMPAAQPVRVVAAARSAPRPMRRTMDGMLVPTHRASIPVQRPVQQQPLLQQATPQPRRPVQIGVISDFIPATE